jgi:prephenate dehydrogenase
MKAIFKKVVIVGVGLIGGSIALGLKRRRAANKVVGVFHRKASLDFAIRSKVVDEAILGLRNRFDDADVVIVATPVLKSVEIIKKVSRLIRPDCIITDVGSTKRYIVKEVEKSLLNSVRFVGAHPLAGHHLRGISAASERLFERSVCILTPSRNSDAEALRRIRQMWESLGAEVRLLGPSQHDLILAFTSHLPHIVTISLVDAIDRRFFPFAASGLKDTTRITLSDPSLWTDVCLTNREMILDSLNKFATSLKKMSNVISCADPKVLFGELNRIRKKRVSLEKKRGA